MQLGPENPPTPTRHLFEAEEPRDVISRQCLWVTDNQQPWPGVEFYLLSQQQGLLRNSSRHKPRHKPLEVFGQSFHLFQCVSMRFNWSNSIGNWGCHFARVIATLIRRQSRTKPVAFSTFDLTVLIIITCRNGLRNSAVATVVGSTSAEGSEDKMVSSWIRLAQTHQATWSRSMGVSRQLPTLIEDARVGWTKILHVKSLWPATKCIGLCLASFSRPWKPSTELTSTPWRPVRTPCFCSIRRRSFTCKASTLSGKLGCTESWMIVDDHK